LFKSSGTKTERPASGFGGRDAAPSILSVDLKITGDVVGGGELVVAGQVHGDIVAKKITIAEGGSVTGAVEADTAMVAGTLTGQLKASAVTLASTAKVVADITHVSLMIESGAVFEGYSRRVDNIDQRGASLPLALPGTGRPAAVTAIGGGKATSTTSEPATKGSVSTVS
jgi:cytoskeletal protein CcmA (bactofilin family)